MMNRFFLRLPLLLGVLSLAGACAKNLPAGPPPSQALQDHAPNTTNSAPLPLDPAVEKGQLANGLTYYIRGNQKPEKRAALRLVVNAGSVLEDEDQRGLAHFIEHMAFNGTRLFEKHEILNTLEKAGVKFGSHTNAYTGFDETVYMLEVPTDDEALLEKALLILQQFATDVAFDPAEVEKERGVVVEEWRSGRGAQTRVLDQQLPILLKGSRYAERLPIGEKKVLETASLDTIKRFYKQWYRPNLMSVVAVGDFDSGKVKATIEKLFGPLKNPETQRPREDFPLPHHEKTRVSIATDKELPQTSIAVVHTMPVRSKSSKSDYRRMILENLYHQMMNARLSELTKNANPPFLMALSTTESFSRASDMFLQIALVDPSRTTEALAALTREIERVERFGFTESELQRARGQMLRQMESMAEERLKTPSARLADEIVRNFLTAEAMPGIAAELALYQEMLPEVDLSLVNKLAADWVGEDNRVLLLSGPASAKLPDEKALLATFSAVEKETLEAFVDRVAEGPLLPTAPEPGRIVAEKTLPEIGLTTWTLSNGIRVAFKQTDFQNDEVLVRAFSPGGHSLASNADYPSAAHADTVVSEGGLGTFGPVQLEKALSGKLVSVTPYISELEEGLTGRSSPKELQTLFELIHLTATAPRVDADSFAAWVAQQRNELENRSADPEAAFYDALTDVIYNRHLRRRPPTVQQLEKVDMDKALKLYKERFANTADFTFVIVGNTTAEALRPLVQTYLATLPSTKGKETWRDVGAKIATGTRKLEVRQGVEPKAQVVMMFTGTLPWSKQTEFDLEALEQALSIRLREVVREEHSGTYGVRVSSNLSRRPRTEFQMTVSFGCAPDRVDDLSKIVIDEIEKVKQEGLGDDYVTKVKTTFLRQHEVSLKQNGFWLRAIADALRYGDDPQEVLELPALIDTVSPQRLRDTARKVMDTKRHIRAVLRPEKAVSDLRYAPTQRIPRGSAPRAAVAASLRAP